MKTVDDANQSRWVNALFDKARQEVVLVRVADGSELLLTAVDEFADEITRSRANKTFMASLERPTRAPGTLTLDQVERRLGIQTPRKRPSRKSAGQRGRN
jgi:hypothetical protein